MIGEYDHLNTTDAISYNVDIDRLANAVVTSNYGTHRMLSAMVREANRINKKGPMMEAIEKMLEEGMFL